MNRLQQIEIELRNLDVKRETLIDERDRLLKERVAVESEDRQSLLSPSEKIALFLSLFRCRGDVYPKLWENPKDGRKGYSPACRNEWIRGICDKPRVKCTECLHQSFPLLDEAAARDHLVGQHVIGTYAIREDHTCVFLAADFDGAGWKEDIRAYQEAANELGIDVAIERSRSGNGGHAWIFFNEPVPALQARRLGTLIVAMASSAHPAMALSTYDRFFPNQDVLPAGGFGNLIALPLQAKARKLGNTVFLDACWNPLLEPWSFLRKFRRMSSEKLDEILETVLPAATDNNGESTSRYEDRALDLISSAVKRGDFTGIAQVVWNNQLEIETSSMPSCLVAGLKRLGTLANPQFFEKQRLRFGTWNVPRFIFTGEIHPGRLVLPRGVLSQAIDLCAKAGGKLQVEDRRPPPLSHQMDFLGSLNPPQQAAVDAMLEHDDGVLLAPPGAGKTVMGCAMIAARGVSTLVLVHRKPLLDQWHARLREFLQLEKSEIGTLGKCSDPLKYPVVVGMVQTLAKSTSAASLLAPFTHVVIDECHHVPAASFEAVLKECSARYFLGLTATPVRKDGLQRILFLQCGPIRHRMDAKADPEIFRRLIVRDVHLGLPPEDTRIPVHQVWELLTNHSGRNMLIAADIMKCLSEGRYCAVLSDRKEHLATLEKLVREQHPTSVYRIDGSMGQKLRAGLLSTVQERASKSQGFALFATSSLLGEGFDLPELDTLFLTLPVSFKGRLVQYAGRLHRPCQGKSEVRIYDYVEPEHPLTAHMHRKRMVAFRGMDYQQSKQPDEDQFLTAKERSPTRHPLLNNGVDPTKRAD